MVVINDILKERLSNCKNNKERYRLPQHFWKIHKKVIILDNVKDYFLGYKIKTLNVINYRTKY